MALTKEQRDALALTDFAFPEKRMLPIHDAEHVRMAWNSVAAAKGFTDAERSTARETILARADQLGVSTADWPRTVSAAFGLEAMSLLVPDVDKHPNRLPFEGVLTRVDCESDNPVGGANGHRVYIPRRVAEAAIPTLLGMAVGFTPKLDGHNRRAKIGLITEAWVEGDAVRIKGFFYAADFPQEVERIQAEKEQLGFSYEAQARIQSLEADPWVMESCTFTGAAVLYKDLAAYTTTSLAAKAELENQMELKDIMDAVTKLTGTVTTLAADVTELKAGNNKHTVEAAAVVAKVKPLSDSLRASAVALEAAGVGTHATLGHVAMLRNMAATMDAEAATGTVPAVYRDPDQVARALEASKAAAAPAADPATAEALKTVSTALTALQTQVTDLSAKAFKEAPGPGRKTASPEVVALLAKCGIKEGEEPGDKLAVHNVDKTLEAAGITGQRAMEAKVKLMASGLLVNPNAA